MLLSECEFSVRAARLLDEAGFKTTEDLKDFKAEDFRKFRGVGVKTVSEIKDFIRYTTLPVRPVRAAIPSNPHAPYSMGFVLWEDGWYAAMETKSVMPPKADFRWTDATTEGQLAAHQGGTVASNPYLADTPAFSEWNWGWGFGREAVDEDD